MSKLLLIVAFFSATVVQAQEFFPPMGSYTLDELRMKECSFDKNATAAILLHSARSDYDDQYSLLTTYHIRIKILKEKGIEQANIAIPFIRRDDFEYIDRIEGITINPLPDGNTEKHFLEKKSIFFEKSNPNWGEVKFTFPAAKVGSIIEYTYRSVMKNYGGLRDWHFQSDIPVIKSKYRLIVVPNVEFTYQVQKSEGYVVDVKTNKSDASVEFEMNNIAGLTDEPYMDARNDYIQKVLFQLSAFSRDGNRRRYATTWPELSKELVRDESFGAQLGRDLAGTDEFVKEMKSLSSSMEKMSRVYDYVRKQMEWNGSNSKWCLDGIKSAWNKKTGTSGDINLILVNLLKSAGLDADPILVSERYHGRVKTNYPFVDQFNTVYAVVSINDRIYYMDATNKNLPAWITPSDILNTTGFIVSRKNPRLVNILDEQFKYDDAVIIIGKVDNGGRLEGNAQVKSKDYARAIKIGRYRSDRQKFIENTFAKGIEGIKIDSFETSGEEVDSLPFIQEFDFNLPLTATEDYRFLDLNLFTGQKSNPFILDNRFANINFGYKQRLILTALIDIPETFAVDELPKPSHITTPDKSIVFQKSISFSGGKLVQNVLIDVNSSLFEAGDYQMVKEFYKLMYNSLNESIVLKKK
jgi:Domain of Unknown Function with PDB structure (DUF3857)